MPSLLAASWRGLVARCAPPRPSPAERALAEVYAIILAAGTPLFLAFIAADAIRGLTDVSYWREIPVNSVVFLVMAALALRPRLALAVRGLGLTIPLTLIAISDQLNAGAGGIAPLVLVLSSAILALWHRQAVALGAALSSLALLGPALLGTASPARGGGAESPAELALRVGTTLIIGAIVTRGMRVLVEASAGDEHASP